jgi:hypothetical protein
MGDRVSEEEIEQLPAVDANALARILGVSPKTIYDLCKAGVLERGAGRMFALEENVARYCEHLRGQLMAASAAQAAE